MGRKPVFGLSGLFLASITLTGCADTECWCPWKDKGPNKAVTYDQPPTKNAAAVKPTDQNPYNATATTGFNDRPAATPDRTAYGVGDPVSRQTTQNDISMPKRPALDTPRDPAMDLGTVGAKEPSPLSDPKNTAVPDKTPSDPRMTDSLPMDKPVTTERNKPIAEPLPVPDEPPPPIPGSNGKIPGLGGPTNEDLPPAVEGSSDSVPPPAPLPPRSKFQSNHQSIPAPPGSGNPPPIMPGKPGSTPDSDQ
jgi:hypothetical protein